MSTLAHGAVDVFDLLQPALDHTNDLVTIVDAETGLLVYVNARCIEALGYPREDLVGHRLPVASATAEAGFKSLLGLTGGEKAASFEAELKRRTGKPLIVDVSPLIVEHGGRRYVTSVLRDLSVRKQMEARLEESDARMRRAMRASRTLAYDIELAAPDKAIVYGLSSLLGLPDECTAEGRKVWQERVHPDDFSTFDAAVEAQIRHGERLWIDYRIRHADGHWLWVHEEGEVLNVDGRPTRIFGTITDISERIGYEQALRQSESRFRTTFENAAVGVSHLTVDGCWIEVNGTLCAITGYSREELLGRDWKDLTFPPDADIDLTKDHELLTGEVSSYLVEKRFVRKDASIVWVSVSVSLARKTSGEPDYLIAITRDISGRKRAEAALVASHDTFRHLVENSPFGLYTVDADFRLTGVSAGARKVFANVDPLIGRDFADVLRQIWPEEFAAVAIKHFRHTLESGETYRSASTVERRRDVDAVEAYDWRIERILMPDGRFGVVCHFYDLSERQRHEEQIRRLLREVNHRSRNLLAIVQAIARSTSEQSRADFLPRFIERLQSLSVSQDLLVRNDWRGVLLDELVERQLEGAQERRDARMSISGEPIFISPAAAQNLGMALHELASNATRHGALSKAAGRIAISWSIRSGEGGQSFLMSWVEESPTPVLPPDRAGFGSRMIGRLTETGLSAKVTIDYSPTGFRWHLVAPLADLLADDE